MTDRPDHEMIILESIWSILDETNGSEGFITDLVNNSIRSWKRNQVRIRSIEK